MAKPATAGVVATPPADAALGCNSTAAAIPVKQSTSSAVARGKLESVARPVVLHGGWKHHAATESITGEEATAGELAACGESARLAGNG